MGESKFKLSYVPFKSFDEFLAGYSDAKGMNIVDEDGVVREELFIKTPDGTVVPLVDEGEYGLYYKIKGEFRFVSWENLAKSYTFLDGSPCGFEVEESRTDS